MATELPSPTVLEKLRHEGARWFPELGTGPVDLQVLAHHVRPRSTLTTVLLGGAVRVVVKGTRTGPALESRPRLGIGDEDLVRRDALEWDGLRHAWEACGGGGRPGVAAVRPLAHLADERAVVMSHVDGATVREVVRSASRAGRTSRAGHDLVVVLRRMAAWLATFHRQGGGTESVRDSVEQLCATATAYAEHLEARRPHGAALAWRLAGRPPEGSLPLGLGHGDFAPRNGIVTGAGEVAVIDVLGRWRLPVYEDLALLLLELRTGGPQLLTAGHAFAPATLRSLEDAVLDGYRDASGEPLDRAALAWFSGLVLVDRWAAHAARPPNGAVGRVRRAVVDRSLHRETDRAMARLDVGGSW